MSKEKNNKKRQSSFMHTLRRMFLGSRASEMTLADERYDSPSKLVIKRFFRKPLAVGALLVLLAMFAFVIIGPMFSPYDPNYTDGDMANVQPNFSMMSIPSSMKTDPLSISSTATFTIGVDKNGKVHMWGSYKAVNKKKDVMTVPDEVKNANIVFAAAGTDHCIAISSTGKVYGWGEYDNAQYGLNGRMVPFEGYIAMPTDFVYGTIDVNNVKQLICGYQATAVLMNDGALYAWGNGNAVSNLQSMLDLAEDGVKFEKIGFTLNGLFAISADGEFITGNNTQFVNYQSKLISDYIGERKVVDIAAGGNNILLLLDDNELMGLGKVTELPNLESGDVIKSISAAKTHLTLTTESGKIYAWGANTHGETNIPKKLQSEGAVDTVYSVGYQNYAFKDGKLVGTWGLKGFLFGTNDVGQDIFNLVMNGGKNTMTIGAVAVIVSSIIGIIVGCISGYFGGKVDMILMRITEIFSAIPFLPFALILSAVMTGNDMQEETRMFIIMIILGLLSWTGLATLVRGQILAEREKEFVTAARSMGVKEKRIAFKHVLPNIISVIIVNLTLNFASCMLTESSLSYLGFGVKDGTSWGKMLNGSKNENVIQTYWWRWLFPALFLAITVVCINIIGDTLRDILDPKSEVEK